MAVFWLHLHTRRIVRIQLHVQGEDAGNAVTEVGDGLAMRSRGS